MLLFSRKRWMGPGQSVTSRAWCGGDLSFVLVRDSGTLRIRNRSTVLFLYLLTIDAYWKIVRFERLRHVFLQVHNDLS